MAIYLFSFGNIAPIVKPNFYPNYAGAIMTATVAPSKVAPSTLPCHFRWIQVAQIFPPVTSGKGSGLYGLSNLNRPWVDVAIGSVLPYFTDVFDNTVTTIFGDKPSLARSHISTATPRIKFRFETACMCLRSGKKDQFIGWFTWGFSFGSDPADDRLLGDDFDSAPTPFWKDGVAKDFPNYPFVV